MCSVRRPVCSIQRAQRQEVVVTCVDCFLLQVSHAAPADKTGHRGTAGEGAGVAGTGATGAEAGRQAGLQGR